MSRGLGDVYKRQEYGVKKSREQAESIGQAKLEKWVTYFYSCISGVKCGLVTPQSALQTAQNSIFFAVG